MGDDAGDHGEPRDDKPDGEGGRGHAGDEKTGDPDGRRAGTDRSDQLADATGDPLAAAFGGTAGESADQFYRTWVRTVKSSGPATVIGGGTFRDLSIGGTTIYSYDRRAQPPGPVRSEVLDDLTRRYAKVAGYDMLLDRLRSTNLLVLRGAPGTGRTATVLRLLAAVASEAVSRFGPETDLRSLPDSELEPGFGYLMELVPGWGNAPPLAMHIDRLRGQLTDRKCFMVLVAPHDIRYRTAFEDYIADCPLPDAQIVLDLAVEHEIRKRPDLAAALQNLGASTKLAGSSARRLPSEIRWLVTLMVSHAMGDITFDDMTARSDESLSRYVADWFEPLANIPAGPAADEQVRLATFRIALAVFDQTPYDLVAEAGERLAEEILTAGSPRRRPGRAVFANHRDDYVADSRARLVPGITRFGRAGAPSTFAQYIDERLPAAVLGHVWNVHNIRSPLTSWLRSLSLDQRPYVWMRAALAIGMLSSWDFSYSFHELIDPWARSPDQEIRHRLVAAVALDAAARNDDVRPVVRGILDGWCSKGTREQRWTGATALGYDLGLLDAEKSLKDLRIIGCWEDGDLAPVASWAAARIFARGGIEPVLTVLDDWLGDDRRSVRELALRAVLRIADLRAADLEDPELAGQVNGGRWKRLAMRDRWPLLVAMADEDPGLLEPFVDLVWQVARSAPAQLPSLEVLARWIRAGEQDRSCIGPVARFLALLGDDDSDRARLLHLVGALRRDRDEPLPAAMAGRFERAIEANIHASDGEEQP